METGKDVFYIGNDESILGSREKLEKLSALEEVTMVGYPIGLWDEKNNFPIFRRGILLHIQLLTLMIRE